MGDREDTAVGRIISAAREAIDELTGHHRFAVDELTAQRDAALAEVDRLRRELNPHRGFCEGLMSRRSTERKAAGTRIRSFVHDFHWRNAQPTAFGALSPAFVAELTSLATEAHAAGQSIRLRPFAGIYSPPGLDDTPVSWVDLNEGVRGSAPRWWEQRPRDAWADFMRRLAVEVADLPAVREVVASWGMTIFAEPMQRVFRDPGNVAAAKAGGYTEEKDIESLLWSMQLMHELFSSLGVQTSFSYNVWTGIDGKANEGVALTLMKQQVEILGDHAVLMNNGAADPLSSMGKSYERLWKAMAQHAANGVAVSLQTRALKNMPQGSTALGTAKMWIELGAQSVEMPAGWLTQISQGDADTLNARWAQ